MSIPLSPEGVPAINADLDSLRVSRLVKHKRCHFPPLIQSCRPVDLLESAYNLRWLMTLKISRAVNAATPSRKLDFL